MLETRKFITINGNSIIKMKDETEITVASMTANIPENGNVSSNTTIINQEVYNANKAECRADMDAFMALVREVEDREQEK